MKSRMVFAFVGTAIASLLPGLVPDAQAGKRCSNAILDGGYGYTVTGTVNGQPFAATGRLAFDGKGKFRNVGLAPWVWRVC